MVIGDEENTELQQHSADSKNVLKDQVGESEFANGEEKTPFLKKTIPLCRGKRMSIKYPLACVTVLVLAAIAFGLYFAFRPQGCGSKDPINTSYSTVPTFSIESSSAPCTKKINVFGLYVHALPGVEDNKIVHAAKVFAQYLDNNEDGVVDNTKVVEHMLKKRAAMVMWKTKSIFTYFPPNSQDLGADETSIDWHTDKNKRFDASLEEVLHLITSKGFSEVYESEYGEKTGSTIANAMDKARGGRFETIPSSYPSGAWYTYNDSTCSYECMVTEYFYWALTSMLGAQDTRLSEIKNEWKLNTRTKVRDTDVDGFALLNATTHNLPRILPNGNYAKK